MDPTQRDKWWKSRIEKEQCAYVQNPDKKAVESTVVLNTLGYAQETPKVAQPVGAGSSPRVRQQQEQGTQKIATTAASRAMHGTQDLSAPGRHAQGDMDRLESYSQVRASSAVSYPRTPQFSQVSKVGTEIMNRLARLESDLQEERRKREAAEQEMKELMARAQSAQAP